MGFWSEKGNKILASSLYWNQSNSMFFSADLRMENGRLGELGRLLARMPLQLAGTREVCIGQALKVIIVFF